MSPFSTRGHQGHRRHQLLEPLRDTREENKHAFDHGEENKQQTCIVATKRSDQLRCHSPRAGPAASSQPEAGPAKHTAANFALTSNPTIPLPICCNPPSERDPRCKKALFNLPLSPCTHTRAQPQVHQGKQGQHQASTFDLRNRRTPQTPAT